MKDLRQTSKYAKYMQAIGWKVVEVNSVSGIVNRVYIRNLPLLGAIAKLQRPGKIPTTKQFDALAKEHNLAVLYIEPITNKQSLTSYNAITSNDFSLAKNSFVPPKTIHINLRKSEKELLKNMKHKTRYNIKQAQKRGVVIKESDDIDAFIELWHSSARRRGMFLPQAKEIRALFSAFGKNAHILLAYLDRPVYRGKLLGGVLVVRTPGVGYYMYAASTKEGNKLFAPTLLAWEAIRLAKKKKCKTFDFEGIYDERYPETKRWKGFTRFKKGFGGKTITYPPTLVKYYNPLARILNL